MDSLSVGELVAVINHTSYVEKGKLGGMILGEGRFTDFKSTLRLGGRIGTWQLDRVAAQVIYRKPTIYVEDFQGTINDNYLRLAGEYKVGKVPTYRGVISFTDLDLARLLKQGSEFRSNLDGEIVFSGRGIDSKHFRLKTRPRLRKGSYRDWEFDSIAGTVYVTASDVKLENVYAKIGETTLGTNGNVRFTGQLSLDFDLSSPDLRDLSGYHKQKDLRGGLVADASLLVGKDSLSFEAVTRATEIKLKGIESDSLVLDLRLTRVGGMLRGRANLFGGALRRGDAIFPELIGDLVIEGRKVKIERLAVTRKNGELIGLVGSVEIDGKRYAGRIENLFVEAGGVLWENDRPIEFTYRPDSLTIQGLTMRSEAGLVWLSETSYSGGWIDTKSGVTNLDLRKLKRGPRSTYPTGILNASLSLSGTFDDIAFDLGFGLVDGEIRSVGFDTIEGEVTYRKGELSIERIVLREGEGRIEATGDVPVDLSPARISYLSRQDSLWSIVTSLGHISIEGTGVDISFLSPLAPPLEKLRGVAEFKVSLEGTAQNPTLATSGRLKQATYGNADIGEVVWDIVLRDSLLSIAQLEYGRKGEKCSIRGEVPIAISVAPFRSHLLERPVDITLEADGSQLGLLCELFPRLKECSGTYSASLLIKGTTVDPVFFGRVDLSQVGFRLEGIPQDVRDIYLALVANGKAFEIESLVAEDGALKARGEFAIDQGRVNYWDLRIDLKNFMLTEFEDFYAKLDGELRIASEELESGKMIPKITGKIKIKEGDYYYTPAAVGEGGGIGPTTSPSWLMNVEVEIPNDFWVRGGGIEAELQGSVNVKRGPEGLLVLGGLRTIRGKFTIYNNSFKITRGEFRFTDVTSLKNVYIDLEADSRVLEERITVTASGYLDRLDVSATSESGWSETQIFEALTLRRGAAGEEAPEPRFFTGELLRSWGLALMSRFGDQVARELRLDRFGLEAAGEGDILTTTRVTFGKYISDKLYLQYSQSLATLYGTRGKITQRGLAFPERQLSVEYRLSDRLTIEGEAGTVGGLGYFDVDLRLRFGY